MEIKDKVALITGTRRIGSVVAMELARRGADVVLGYNRSQEEAEAAPWIRTSGGGHVDTGGCLKGCRGSESGRPGDWPVRADRCLGEHGVDLSLKLRGKTEEIGMPTWP
jgi:NAD(P)-dependent dehydrogenase (short-subunit alcohol dehydrogenase family)